MLTRDDPDDAGSLVSPMFKGSDRLNRCSGIRGSGIREDKRMIAFWFSIFRRFYFTRLSVLLAACLAASAQQDRILVPIDNSHRVKLLANQSLRAQSEFDTGPVDPVRRIEGISLMLRPSANQLTVLDRLLEQLQDPGSSNYHSWLTPEQYAERFGMSPADIAKITEWLKTEGFTVDYVARARNWIMFSGPESKVESAFLTELRHYQVDGEMHYASRADPSIPAALEPVVQAVLGLDDFRPKPPRAAQAPAYTATNGSHFLGPGDIATVYDINPIYQSGFTGSGVTIAVAGQTAVNLSDIQLFRNVFGLPDNDPQLILVPGTTDPGIVTTDILEASLDIEYSGAAAPVATIKYIYSKNVVASVEYAIDQNVAQVVSYSYAGCESGSSSAAIASFRQVAMQANAQGITWVAASGDNGPSGCDTTDQPASHGLAVDFPASFPEVTAVGGSEYNEGAGQFWSPNNLNGASALSYIPEVAWNDSSQFLGASGGGASMLFPKPSWQTGPGVPNDNARDVPDICLAASPYHDSYIIAANGTIVSGLGGTSIGTPTFAGVVALLNHYLISKGLQPKPGLGNINPTLYRLAATTSGTFHDITVGNNIIPCATGSPSCVNGQLGYNAGSGYDQVTGLGSLDVYNVITRFAGATASAAPSLSVSNNQITFSYQSGFTNPSPTGVNVSLSSGSLSFTAVSSATAWLQVAPAAGTLGTGNTALLISVTPSTLTAATYKGTITISVPGTSNSPQTITVTLNVTASGSAALVVSPTTVSFTGDPVLITFGNNVSVSSTGAPLSFSIQSKPGSWLSFPYGASGTTPGTVFVGADVPSIFNMLPSGTYTDSFAITAPGASNSPQTVTATLDWTNASVPAFVDTNAASYRSGFVSPGENIVLFGVDIGPAILSVGKVTNSKFPTSLAGTQVLFDGVPAPIIYASATQTSVMVPYEVAGKVLTDIQVTYQGVSSVGFFTEVIQASPGIYAQSGKGTGPGSILNQDFSANGPTNPAAKGSVVAVYMTGEGLTSPPSLTGGVAPVDGSGLNSPLLPISAVVNGEPATILYHGSAPGLVYGVMQVNLQIPATVPAGNLPIIISVAGHNTQDGVTVSVR